MEIAPLLMGCYSFQGLREARTAAPGSALSGGLEWEPGGMCVSAHSKTAPLFLCKRPLEGLLPAKVCLAGLLAHAVL